MANLKHPFRLLTAFLLFFTSFLSLSAQVTYQAHLSGRHEVTPVLTGAFGEVTATLDGNTLQVAGSFSNLSSAFNAAIAGGAHLHLAPAGTNGGVAFPLVTTLDVDTLGGVFDPLLNTFILDATQLAALVNQEAYVNIHTLSFPSGELRGQLVPEAAAYYHINLLGINEVPAVYSSGFGALTLQLHADTLVVSGSFAGLESDFNTAVAGGAHLHMGLPGANGGVELSLTASVNADMRSGTFDPDDNTFVLTAAQLDAVAAQALYANIHSVAQPRGELRGQLTATSTAAFRGHLSGANEIPVVTSSATGVIQAQLVGDTLTVWGSFSGLESDVATSVAGGAHLHFGLAGATGGIAFGLTGSFDADLRGGSFVADSNQFVLTAEEKATLLARGLYVNIHSVDHPSGELRAQLLPETQAAFTGLLSGIFESPAISTSAYGAVKAELLGDQLTVSGSFTDLSSAINVAAAGGAHLHLAAAGTNGGIAFPLVFAANGTQDGGTFAAAANTFTLTEDQITAFLDRAFYVNIHSINYPGGELRGQLLQEANFYMHAPLSGTSHTPSVRTEANGGLVIEVTGETALMSGGFTGLSSNFNAAAAGGAHIHAGLAGQGGGIIFPLMTDVSDNNRAGTFAVSDNSFTLSEGQLDTLRARAFYTNIHSVDHPGGEIRGQVLPVTTAYFTSSLMGINEVQPVATGAQGSLKLELNGDQLTLSGAFSGLAEPFDASIAGGSHLHLAGPGANGGIAFSLTPTLAADLLSGSYLAADNQFTLSADQVDAVLAGDYYANIHTTAFPSGELRGQILPEVNFFPDSGPVLVLPNDGSSITVEGGFSTEFTVQWLAATDENDLAYIWQVAASADFSTVLFAQNVGSNLSFNTDFETIDGLLADVGIDVGASATLYHRVLASDGSVFTPGDAFTIDLVRGIVVEDTFIAELNGQQEVFPVVTTASGQVTARLDGLQLVVTGSFSGLSSPLATDIVGGAHLHTGYAGQTGGIALGLTVTLTGDGTAGTFDAADNTFTLTMEQAQAIRERRMYVNVHSIDQPSGEIRGQLLPEASTYYWTNLFGSNEVPSVMTSGHGALALEVKDDFLTVSGAFDDLDSEFNAAVAGGAHLHLALPGSNGGVQIPLVVSLDTDLLGGVFEPGANTFPLTEDMAESLENYRVYANIHTIANGGGEIRGQVVANSLAVLRAHLSGSNETLPVTTMAGGEVQAALINDTTLVVFGSFADLESDINTAIAGGAHLHTGLSGMNGGVLLPLTISANGDMRGGSFETAANTFVLTAGQIDTLLDRGIYVNIHTLDNASGELRGQLVPESQSVLTGYLLSIFEVPNALSTGGGQVKAELQGNTLTVSGAFSGLSSPVATDIAGGAHLHLGAAGATGPVAFPLNLELTGDSTSGFFAATANTFELSDGQVDTLRARGFYANLHTLNFPSGELRSQLLGEANTYFVAPLSGTSQTPAINTSASGMAVMEVRSERSVVTGSFMDLSSALNTGVAGGVHIHAGLAGQNGPVVNLINTLLGTDALGGVFNTVDNLLALTPGFIDTLRARNYYLNVHSIENGGGEIRGQFLPLSTAYFTASLRGQNEVQPIMTSANGGLKVELLGNRMTLTGSFADLSGAFDETVAGGSHLHLALPGLNGGIDLTLAANLAMDTLSGTYLAADNTFTLEADQVAALVTGQYYANIHTTAFPGGELRSQLLPEINFFPTDEAAIVSPNANAMVLIEGDATMPFIAEWSAASDRDTLAYIWQLSTEADFSAVVLEVNVANNLAFTTDFGTVDALLESIGVLVGESDTLYHRALASDGNVAAAGEASSVVLIRGMVTAIQDPIAGELDIALFPTLATETLNLRIQSERGARMQAILLNSMGQRLEQFVLPLLPGENNSQLAVHRLPAGTYFLTMIIGDRVVATRRFIKN